MPKRSHVLLRKAIPTHTQLLSEKQAIWTEGKA